ncbi:hypothetical protein PENSPDRAFT_556083, partial [Peniophora sp. CONT]
AVVVNSLWFVGLFIALTCALLATMVQEWTRRFLRGQVRLVHESQQQFSIELMSTQMAAERWYLDQAASIVVALMHVAVVVFIIGLDVYLYTINPRPAVVASTCTGILVLAYVGLSTMPLFRAACPYYTP